MKQAVESVAAKATPPRSFGPFNAKLAVASYQGSELIDDAGIWIDHAETQVQMMIFDLERPDSHLAGDAPQLQANLHAVLGALRMARGMVEAMPYPALGSLGAS